MRFSPSRRNSCVVSDSRRNASTGSVASASASLPAISRAIDGGVRILTPPVTGFTASRIVTRSVGVAFQAPAPASVSM